jgi:hypothetical protein
MFITVKLHAFKSVIVNRKVLKIVYKSCKNTILEIILIGFKNQERKSRDSEDCYSEKLVDKELLCTLCRVRDGRHA